jgi:hypothetical protein
MQENQMTAATAFKVGGGAFAEADKDCETWFPFAVPFPYANRSFRETSQSNEKKRRKIDAQAL